VRLDCPYCGKIGSLYPEHIIRGETAVTTYFCDACHSEWDERENERTVPARPRKRLPMTRQDKDARD
jgi:hypothetical protein